MKVAHTPERSRNNAHLLDASACAIQTCLSRNSYNQAKCEQYVEALYRCCDQFYKAVDKQSVTNMAGVERPEVVESTACPIRSIVERKMKQFDGEAQR